MGDITIYYMQMTDRDALRAKAAPAGMTVELVDPPDGRVNWRYYEEVGRGYTWIDRLEWTDAQWAAYAQRPGMTTWIARLDGQEIGYAEIERQDASGGGGDVQICYFGLLPGWIGKGLGGAFLSRVVEIAWGMPGARRVWLHTCTGDHPNAIGNYEARGFVVYREARGGGTHSGPAVQGDPGL